jgi:hypothetical protein
MDAGKADTLDLRKLREAAEAKDETKNPELVEREETFNLRYQSPEGKTLETGLVSRILSGDERHVVSRMCALLSNGVPFSNLPLGDQARFYALAICSVQLRDPPGWVERWMKEDTYLLDAVFEQLEGHDRRYFRRDLQEGGDGTQFSSVEVTPIKSSADYT